MDQDQPTSGVLTEEVVRALSRDLLDATVAKIVATGFTVADLEAALAWAAGEDDEMGETRHPLTGPAAAIYDLLTTEYDPSEEP